MRGRDPERRHSSFPGCFPDSLRTAVARARAKPPQTKPPITIRVTQVAVVMGLPIRWGATAGDRDEGSR